MALGWCSAIFRKEIWSVRSGPWLTGRCYAVQAFPVGQMAKSAGNRNYGRVETVEADPVEKASTFFSHHQCNMKLRYQGLDGVHWHPGKARGTVRDRKNRRAPEAVLHAMSHAGI